MITYLLHGPRVGRMVGSAEEGKKRKKTTASTPEIWRYGDMEMWRYGDMEIWRYGDMEVRRHGDVEVWRHGDVEVWKHTSGQQWRADIKHTLHIH